MCEELKRISRRQKERHFNNKHTKTPIDQTKTKLSPQGPQWSRHSVTRVRRRGDHPPSMYGYISGKYGKTRNSLSPSGKDGVRVTA